MSDPKQHEFAFMAGTTFAADSVAEVYRVTSSPSKWETSLQHYFVLVKSDRLPSKIQIDLK